MKTNFVLLILSVSIFTCIHAQEPYGKQFRNMGFEDWAHWDNNGNKYEPLYWHSFKSGVGSLITFTPNSVSRSELIRPGSKGKFSAKVQVKKVLGVKANGTLVNGRMNAGSMSANGKGNYFFTETSNPAFNTPIDCVPDSITIWFCFRSDSKTDSAFIHCSVHGNYNCRLVSDGTYHPSDLLVAKGDGYTIAKSSPKSNDYIWERMSVPFISDHECTHDDSKYILASFSTNNNAGQGNESDELFMDDVLLVYNPTLKTEKLSMANYKISDYSEYIPVDIPYSLIGTMSPYNLNNAKNKVIAELSDDKGNFTSAIVLGSVESDISGVISGKIPKEKIKAGNKYQIRVRTTNYPMTAEPSETIVSFN
ncbi:MAG: hypothetical protein LBP67_08005 [Bacteroidales bacterium]|jgi:hypothetical protein|nr:hypothetical protein [Bacteroidales bacterium]